MQQESRHALDPTLWPKAPLARAKIDPGYLAQEVEAKIDLLPLCLPKTGRNCRNHVVACFVFVMTSDSTGAVLFCIPDFSISADPDGPSTLRSRSAQAIQRRVRCVRN